MQPNQPQQLPQNPHLNPDSDLDVTTSVSKVLIVHRNAKESGNPYKALVIRFANGYSKLVLLNPAELFLVEGLTAVSQSNNIIS